MLTSQYHIDGPPLELMGPSARSTDAIGLSEANGPPKVYGPRGHCPPCPLSAGLGKSAFLAHFDQKFGTSGVRWLSSVTAYNLQVQICWKK